MSDASMAASAGSAARKPAADPGQGLAIVLEPLAHPELGEIVIADALFAVGRNEAPFSGYPGELTSDLSRRHARIFLEHGVAYIADLGSKNGTTVNGVDIRQKNSMLRDGDEIALGPALSYRVRLRRTALPAPAAALQSLTLTPQSSEGGLQPIVITAFPFLVGKTEAAFSQYREAHPRQVDYLSRRHAHIFLKGGAPYLEDLGSTNGTLVGGKRMDEHARRLEEGDVVAFGGLHFVYVVSLQREQAAALPPASDAEPTVTVLARPAAPSNPPPAAAPAPDADRTTFVAAAESFLNIFCAPPAAEAPAQSEADPAAADAPARGADPGKRRSRAAIFLSGMAAALREDEPNRRGRLLAWGALLAAVAGVTLALLFSGGGAEQEIRDLLAQGKPAQAAALAGRQLERNPDSEALRALATEAALKAQLPAWAAQLKARDFAAAEATLAATGAPHPNPDLKLLLAELGWAGRIEKFMAPRAAADAPVRIYADEDEMHKLLEWWNSDTSAHQRTLTRVASIVPEFRDTYAGVLSQLRRLQSDDAVYLAAIDRLKAGIATELKADRLDGIEPLLKETVDKYPRLGGLDAVRADLRLYREIEGAAREGRLGPLAALLRTARFATPPFQARFEALAASGALPPAEVLKQYAPVAAAWQAGQAQEAYARLQPLLAGPWAAQANADLARKKAVAEQFASLQKSRAAAGQDERLLAFYGSLDPLDDAWYIRAVEQDLKLDRAQAQKLAAERMARAEALWRQYRDGGGIEGRQRLEAAVSERFRSQARLLATAQDAATQALRTARQLRAEVPEQWTRTQQEITDETELQRRLLQEARGALDPALVKAKQALLGGQQDGNGKTAETTR
ncbi:MAG: FHA domain-containing protein [Noviherbaspirillum sp.]